jgi:hypothetical protein
MPWPPVGFPFLVTAEHVVVALLAKASSHFVTLTTAPTLLLVTFVLVAGANVPCPLPPTNRVTGVTSKRKLLIVIVS